MGVSIKRRVVLTAIAITLCSLNVSAWQPQRTVGLLLHDNAKSYQGYTLFVGKHHGKTFLIDNWGFAVNSWNSAYEPGQSVYLLENGNLFRCCLKKGGPNIGGGDGGRFEVYTWKGDLVWAFDYLTDNYVSHHDVAVLPNGNFLALAVELKDQAAATQAGFNPALLQVNYICPEYVVEFKQNGPTGYTIVWQWHLWDHLIQNFDKTKDNYGVVADHRELVNPNGDGRKIPAFWNHANSIRYNAKFDQICINIRGNNEFWIIDHSTTTQEAASHTGGKYGKGGDLLYRWGNPLQYGAGTAKDQKLFQQHDAQWIEDGCPGAGNMLVFNNGLGRPDGMYSSIEEIVLPVDSNGNYTAPQKPGDPFLPASAVWTYKANPPTSFYSPEISGCQRLPNGNTLICDGLNAKIGGHFFEVTPSNEIVWRYVNPMVDFDILSQGDTAGFDPRGHRLNAIFKIHRYSPNYAGFQGQTLTPGDPVEKNPWPLSIANNANTAHVFSFTINPNQRTISLRMTNQNPSGKTRVTILTSQGRMVVSKAISGETFQWKADGLPGGVYLVNVSVNNAVYTKRFCLVK